MEGSPNQLGVSVSTCIILVALILLFSLVILKRSYTDILLYLTDLQHAHITQKIQLQCRKHT